MGAMKFLRELEVLSVFLLYCAQALEQECVYKYTRQPLVALTCNPYGGDNRLILTCSVEGPNFPSFSIIWFRRTTNGTEELANSQQGLFITGISSINSESNVTRVSSNLQLTELNQTEDDVYFWCQVRLTNNRSLFQEKSNVLALPTVNSIDTSFGQCRGSQSVDQVNCLTLPAMVPTTTNSCTITTLSSSDFSSTSQTTGGSIDLEKAENRHTTLYVIIVVAVVVAVMILVSSVAIGLILWWKQKHIARYCEENGRHEQQETRSTTEHQPLEAETTAASEYTREGFDFKENVAYNSSPVNNITLTENVAYETTMPPRAASPLEAEYEEIDYY